MIRVLIADDSPTVRALLVAILESDPELRVVGQAQNGSEAVEMAIRLRPDLITMDVQMPLLDGLEATKEIMVHAPTPIVIVSSQANRANVELSLNAVRAGALMVVPTPAHPSSEQFAGERDYLLTMVKAMARVKVVRRWSSGVTRRPVAAVRSAGSPIRILAVAASTGGPAALQQLLAGLPRDFPLPILIVQHIALGFVGGLAHWLTGSCNLRVKVAEHGEALQGRTAYLAPDRQHLTASATRCVALSSKPPIAGFQPSATYLFEGVAQVFGSSVAAVILTGMGNDGVEGLKAVRGAGGLIIAQDETTSVVYGMPGQAVAAGVVDSVLPLGDIAPRLVAELFGGRSE